MERPTPGGFTMAGCALILDCDGVLVDSEREGIPLLVECATEFGCCLGELDAIGLLRGRAFADCVDVLNRHSKHPMPACLESIYRRKCEREFPRTLRAIVGVHEALESLTIPTYVASNSPRAHVEAVLSIVGLYEHFVGRIFTAPEIGAWKPDPQLYLTIASALCVDPQSCGVVEDSHVGISAALGAGMTVFAFQDVEVLDSEAAPHGANSQGPVVFTRMRDLPQLVTEWSAA
jgi:HAD superfamily hydrolase (TIGR01509 family)